MIDKYTFDGTRELKIDELPTNAKEDGAEKDETKEKFKKNLKKMKKLQEKLYADGKEGLIVVFQAMDAGGKDSTIRKVMTVLNPQGMRVINFKAPSTMELAHDYLWRIHKNVPRKGGIAIFNRSHYEDVVAVQVRGIRESYEMAERIQELDDETFFQQRYEQIRNFEDHLYKNSYRVIKFFLNLSKEEQKERLMDRIERQEKNWKFDAGDIGDRALFDRYIEKYEEAINETATKDSPWYVLPADQKWYTRYLVSEVMVKVMEDCNPKFPEVSQEDLDKMEEAKEILLNEE